MRGINEPTETLLSEMYKSLRSGSDGLVSVTPKIHDRFMLTNVTSQLEKISEFTSRTEKLMREKSLCPRDPSLASRLAARGAIALSTFVDPRRSSVAELIRRETYREARQLGHVLEKCHRRGCDGEASALCREVIAYRLKEADGMKDFL